MNLGKIPRGEGLIPTAELVWFDARVWSIATIPLKRSQNPLLGGEYIYTNHDDQFRPSSRKSNNFDPLIPDQEFLTTPTLAACHVSLASIYRYLIKEETGRS